MDSTGGPLDFVESFDCSTTKVNVGYIHLSSVEENEICACKECQYTSTLLCRGVL